MDQWRLQRMGCCETLSEGFAVEAKHVRRTGMRYEVFAGDTAIGWSELEMGDPPMGVAVGVLHPTSAYPAALAGGNLRVRPEGGQFFDPVAGVHIEDYAADLGEEGIEVSVLGLDATTYQHWFPLHVKSYEEKLGDDAAQHGVATDGVQPRR